MKEIKNINNVNYGVGGIIKKSVYKYRLTWKFPFIRKIYIIKEIRFVGVSLIPKNK
jgi:hypothetical protein